MKTKEILKRAWYAFLRFFGLDSCPVEPPVSPPPAQPSQRTPPARRSEPREIKS